MARELLIEIGTEEIPARFSPPALEQMRSLMEERLASQRIRHGRVHTICTPRRLAICIEDVSEQQAEHLVKAVGPPVRIAFGEDGKPTRAAEGFARNQGVSVEELRVEDMPGKGAYIMVEKREPGRATKDLLPQLIREWICSLGFPKNMRWGTGELRFARPIHWILALFGGEVIPFELDSVRSGPVTHGHRFLHPDSIPVKDFASYTKLLEEGYVVCDPQRRREMILAQARKEAEKAGGRLRDDRELLEEVTHLVEWPVALCGSFDPAFLNLPEEVLATSMRDNQKYFCMVDAGNRLLPRFITISNIPVDDPRLIIAGNERVLRARLSDAAFFLGEDTRRPLGDRVESLKSVVFQEQLGSLYDKVMRIKGLALCLARSLEQPALKQKDRKELEDVLERAALLCKCDLVTEMVKEFPELQGVMGREYALRSGERQEVARAIYEHYLPRFSGDELPESLPGALLSLADKMDTIAGCFSIGLVPTGSEDPHALRRQVQGMIQIILKHGLVFPWEGFVQEGSGHFDRGVPAEHAELLKRLRQFLIQRIHNYFLGQGFAYDLINAVLGAENKHPVFVQKRLDSLSRFRSEAAFGAILTPFKRVINILPEDIHEIPSLNADLLVEDAERKLYSIFKGLEGELQGRISRAEYLEALEAMVALKEPIDAFFDKVLVMDKKEELRKNRLALLSSIGSIFLTIADFSKIVQEQG